MCGIVGYLDLKGEECNRELLAAMNDQIIHRGPDDEGYYFSHELGFGFRRLSIIDLSKGHQPLANEDDTVWLLFNGEIYNYKELRKDLLDKGHEFKTETDSEVIVHLYEEYGTEFVKMLRGMFAIAIWDNSLRRLLLARDLFGIKPLYYAVDDGFLAFGSEIKSLLKIPEVSREVDREAFWNYLTFQYVPEPRTMFEGVKKLPPAHFLLYEDGKWEITRYDQLDFQPHDLPLSYFVEGTLDVLRDSVRMHMNSDVPRGAFLSSGVDSSAIVALLKEIEEVQTFTVGFEGAGGQSELEFAKETARLLGTTHRDTVISAKQYWEMLPRLVYHQDEPVADPSAIALYFVAELASQYVTVVLSGEGADEIFGGYTIYREPLSLKMFDKIPSGMRKTLGDFAELLPFGMKGRGFLLRGSKPLEERFFGNAYLFSERDKQAFVSINPEQEQIKRSTDITKIYYDQAQNHDPITKMQLLDLHTWLPGDILMKADKMTMANSLELRVPFLDKEVFQFAAQIPSEYRFLNGTTKNVLREAVRSILPKEVAQRKKLGFPVPLRKWLREDFYEPVRELIGSSKLDDLFDKEHVLHMLDEHRAGIRDHARKVWAIVIFLLWYEAFVSNTRVFVPEAPASVQIRRERTLVGAEVGYEL